MKNLEQLLENIRRGTASAEEIASARNAYIEEFELLKREDPEQYLEVLETLEAGFDRLERDLTQVLSELEEPKG